MSECMVCKREIGRRAARDFGATCSESCSDELWATSDWSEEPGVGADETVVEFGEPLRPLCGACGEQVDEDGGHRCTLEPCRACGATDAQGLVVCGGRRLCCDCAIDAYVAQV